MKIYGISRSSTCPLLCSLAGFGILLAGCSAITLPVPRENVVMVDRTGVPVDPTGNTGCKKDGFLCEGRHSRFRLYPPIEKANYEKYTQDILDALGRQATSGGKKKILIFIHGGLNTQLSTVERAVSYHKKIEEAGYFPIFIDWQSSLVSSYFNQLAYQRQGRDWKSSPLGWALAPFYLVKDLARAVARLVPVEVFMFRSDLQAGRSSKKLDDKKQLVVQAAPVQAGEIAFGEDRREWPEKLRSLSAYVVTIPTKLLLSPLLDAFGTSAWDSMLRASETPFRSDELTRAPFRTGIPSQENLEQKLPPDLNPAIGVRDTNGGLNVFITRLRDYIESNGGKEKFEVVLVGHSMGAIVINHILREQPSLPVTNIVYMAAACTIKDYEDSVFPYLRSHPKTHIYHLALHRIADVRDRTTAFGFGVLDLPPRGSLLVWIDNFLSDPKTYRDRTAGRTENFVTALGDMNEWKDIAPRVHFREFSVGGEFNGTDPQHHGDFGKVTYWDPECWKPNPTDRSPKDCYDSERP
jgi:pimeloyl-ACP methyl ester carboxylesterase